MNTNQTPQAGPRDAEPAAVGDSCAKSSFFSRQNLMSLAILVFVILVLRWSVASPYHVPTASMEPTIKVGDRVLGFKLAYHFKVPFTEWTPLEWAAPKRGEIIIFKYPRNPDDDYVKRVVGVEGDEIRFVDDILYVNGKAQPRVSAEEDRAVLDDIEDAKEVKALFRENLDGTEHWVMQHVPKARRFAGGNWPPAGMPAYKVKPNSVFVVGDNRDNSTDSRVWHEVPLTYVRGKALFVIWSMHTPPGNSFPALRWSRIGKILH